MRAGLPVLLGFIPVGIAYAVIARQAGFTVAETVLMSVSVFAGASQMMAAGMYAEGASFIAIILTTLILNLRHVIMSTCVFNRMKDAKGPSKLIAAFGVTDESFAIFTTEREERCKLPFFLGIISVTYSSWVAGTAIGAIASDLLPPLIGASLGIALYAMFIALIVPAAKRSIKLCLLIVLTAVVNSVLSIWLDSSTSLIASTLACAGAGVFFIDSEELSDEN